MARAIDSEVAFRFLTEQLVKETGAFSKGVNKGLNIARSAMRNQDAIPTLAPPTEWIFIEDRLPEECADILLCRKILKIPEIGTYQQARFWVYDEIGDVYQVDDVTHWLPIPTPYDIEHIHISEPPEG